MPSTHLRHVILGLLPAGFLAACDVDVHDADSADDDDAFESRRVGAFHTVENQSSAGLVVTDDPSGAVDDDHVRVTCDRDQVARVLTRVEDGTLVVSGAVDPGCAVSVRPGSLRHISVTGDGDLSSFHGLASIESLEVHGQGDATIDAVSSASFTLVTRGGGEVSLGELDSRDLDLDLGGNATVHLAGRSVTTHLEMHGNASLFAGELLCERLEADLTGNSYAEISVSDHLAADVSGNAELVVFGDPFIDGVLSPGIEIRAALELSD